MGLNGDIVTNDTELVLASSIEEMMSHGLLLSPKCWVFKTPAILYRQNEKAFIPDAFSIGPLHHGHSNLKATETIKAKYLEGLISRLSCPETRKARLLDLIHSVKAVEREARECYAEPINYSPEEFVKILVIDGCFIIELFRKDAYEELRGKDDPIFSRSCMLQCLFHDLRLLENQVPWIVLERLFKMTKEPRQNVSLTHLAIQFFRTTFSATPPSTIPPIQNTRHIVDLLRKWLVTSTRNEQSNIEWQIMPSATTLAEAGIKFRKGTSESILDIEFVDGVLKIPPLLVYEATESVFRNIISFEQCYTDCEARLTSYAILIDSLINTANDVDILRENGIIDNWINPEDTVQFFSKLYHIVYVKTFYYGSLCNEVDRYCRRSWPRWRAMFVRNYFNSPWTVLSTLAAVLLLVLSFLQTWYTMNPPS